MGWEVSYGAEFVPDAKDAYTVIIQKPTKLALAQVIYICLTIKNLVLKSINQTKILKKKSYIE